MARNIEQILNRMMMVFDAVTQKELAEALGVSQDLVSNWKRGKASPTWSTLDKVVQKTGVSWEWLMRGESADIGLLLRIYVRFAKHNPFFTNIGKQYLEIIVENPNTQKDKYLEAANRLFYISCFIDNPKSSLPEYLIDAFIEEEDLGCIDLICSEDVKNILFEYGYKSSFTAAYDIYKLIIGAYKQPKKSTFLPKIYAKPSPPCWPVRGLAAADESNGTRVPDTDYFDDPVNPPPGLTCVPVTGDSMSPVVLSGQYVLIDENREGFEEDGGIVVASIRDADGDDERKETMTGTFVKRCYDGKNGLYYFTSINEYSPFSAWIDHCRIWPVIGVWFAGKGKPPREM